MSVTRHKKTNLTIEFWNSMFVIYFFVYMYLFGFVFAYLLGYWNSSAVTILVMKIKMYVHVSYMQLFDYLRIHNIYIYKKWKSKTLILKSASQASDNLSSQPRERNVLGQNVSTEAAINHIFILFYFSKRLLKLFPLFFIKFLFHQMVALLRIWKMFISSKKLFSFSRYSNFCISIPKITSANLCKPIQDIVNYSTSICPFEPGKFGKEGNISKMKRAF